MTVNGRTHENTPAAVFRDKPELIIGWPEWLLSEGQIARYQAIEKLAIVEIAGRDSVAAAVRSVEERQFTDLLPVYAYTGTESGEWAHIQRAVDRLSRRLPEVVVHPLLVMGSPGFWRAINGGFISELFARYGFYSPCPGCHLYLHAARIPLAVKLGNIPIISGERELHTGMVKINQTADALDFYLAFAERFHISLLFPLRRISSGDEIERILQAPWKRGKEQVGCALSGNYRMIDNTIPILPADIRRFFEDFAGPAAEKIIAAYLSGIVPDHHTVARQVLHDVDVS
jgi:hypothetical protein